MNVTTTEIEGVLVIEPDVYSDHRGSFSETYVDKVFGKQIGGMEFVQDNESRSRRGVIRGLHYQKEPHAQTKLVRAVCGRILDVAVDMRRSSPTFGRWVAVELSDENHRQLLIPKGFAHGFSVLSETAVVAYKCDSYYAPNHEAGVAWNDATLAVDWRIAPGEVIVSDKDDLLPPFAEAYCFD